jgi:hypothetical protein
MLVHAGSPCSGLFTVFLIGFRTDSKRPVCRL